MYSSSSNLSYDISTYDWSINSSPCLTENWVLQPVSLTDSKVIALAFFEQSDYAIYMHPEDKRGYRSIVRLINNDRMISTVNREYSSSERIGLALTMTLITEAYNRIVPIAQNAILGNNAHSFDPDTGNIKLGTSEEPVFLHGHVFGRGNPQENYIENIPLDGPIPGVIFDLRAKSLHEPGNEKKVNWKPEEMSRVIHRIRAEIECIQNAYKIRGLTIISQNFFFDIYMIRHGETDWNRAHKLQGHTDIPLNAQGKLQAGKLREKFTGINFSKIISSDLIRARLTTELCLEPDKSTQIETSPLLRERSFGIWEGRFTTELKHHFEQTVNHENMTREEYVSFKWDDTIESYSGVYERIKSLIRSIIISSRSINDPILLSTHGGVMRAILYSLNFKSGYRWKVANCAFIKLRVQSNGQIKITACEGVTMLEIKEICL